MINNNNDYPQLRKDPITGRWVIISIDRAKRPFDWSKENEKMSGGTCPFCPGNEGCTPPEVHALRPGGSSANTSGWTVRVVSNKYPALQIEGDLNRRGEGIYDMMRGIGAHEVIIESPDHFMSLADFSIEHTRDILWVLRDRICDLKKDRRFMYILAYKNYGKAAGASLEHPHIQLVATPIVPKRVQEELEGARRFYEFKERCIFCDIIRQELHSSKRVVIVDPRFIVIEPFAPRFPYETWLMPIQHQSRYENMSYEETRDLAKVLKQVLLRLNATLDNPPYNFIIHTSPQTEIEFPEYHWHIEIIPKLTKVAGFEWGSGFYINSQPPEEAAKKLREVQI